MDYLLAALGVCLLVFTAGIASVVAAYGPEVSVVVGLVGLGAGFAVR